jgi:hypothetical protein
LSAEADKNGLIWDYVHSLSLPLLGGNAWQVVSLLVIGTTAVVNVIVEDVSFSLPFRHTDRAKAQMKHFLY